MFNSASQVNFLRTNHSVSLLMPHMEIGVGLSLPYTAKGQKKSHLFVGMQTIFYHGDSHLGKSSSAFFLLLLCQPGQLFHPGVDTHPATLWHPTPEAPLPEEGKLRLKGKAESCTEVQGDKMLLGPFFQISEAFITAEVLSYFCCCNENILPFWEALWASSHLTVLLNILPSAFSTLNSVPKFIIHSPQQGYKIFYSGKCLEMLYECPVSSSSSSNYHTGNVFLSLSTSWALKALAGNRFSYRSYLISSLLKNHVPFCYSRSNSCLLRSWTLRFKGHTQRVQWKFLFLTLVLYELHKSILYWFPI